MIGADGGGTKKLHEIINLLLRQTLWRFLRAAHFFDCKLYNCWTDTQTLGIDELHLHSLIKIFSFSPTHNGDILLAAESVEWLLDADLASVGSWGRVPRHKHHQAVGPDMYNNFQFCKNDISTPLFSILWSPCRCILSINSINFHRYRLIRSNVDTVMQPVWCLATVNGWYPAPGWSPELLPNMCGMLLFVFCLLLANDWDT